MSLIDSCITWQTVVIPLNLVLDNVFNGRSFVTQEEPQEAVVLVGPQHITPLRSDTPFRPVSEALL